MNFSMINASFRRALNAPNSTVIPNSTVSPDLTGAQIIQEIERMLNLSGPVDLSLVKQLFELLDKKPLTADMHYKVGQWYGTGIKNMLLPDLNKAHVKLILAACYGHYDARSRLANMYECGKAQTQKNMLVAKAYLEVVDPTDLTARKTLSTLFFTTNQAKKGKEGLELCAQKGHTGAQVALGKIYCNNTLNIPPQFKLAKHYFTCAAKQGDEESTRILTILEKAEQQYQNGMENLNNQHWEQAKICFQDSAIHGHANAQCQLALFQLSINTPESYKAAMDNLTKSAAQNDPEALYYLAAVHYSGKGTSVNLDLAMKYMNQSAELNYPKALTEITALRVAYAEQMFDRGISFEHSDEIEKAKHCFQDAIDAGHIKARVRLAVLQLNDNTTASDSVALGHLKKAAIANDAAGLYHLGTLYLSGRGVPQSNRQAAQLFKRAANQEHSPAQYALALIQLQENTPESCSAAVINLQKAADNELFQALLHLSHLDNVSWGLTID